MVYKLTKAVTKNKLIRIYAVNSKEIVETAHKFHKTLPLATAALGRLLTGAVLMGSMMKEEDASITLQLHGDGPLGRVLAVADAKGNVKGYVENPLADLPLNRLGKIDVGGGVGQGYLSVVKDLKLKEPYIGQVPIQTGEIGDDLAFYFAQSEQVPSLVALGVLVDRDYSVKQAGGFIVQVMPDCDEFNLKKLEKATENLTSVTAMLEKGLTNEQLIREVMKDFEIEILEDSEPKYFCDCKSERIERAIISLGKKEIQDIIDEQGEAEVLCQFCDKVYRYDKEKLEELLKKAKK